MNDETPLERFSYRMAEHKHIEPESAMYTQVELERIIKIKNQQIATLNFELKKLKEALQAALKCGIGGGGTFFDDPEIVETTKIVRKALGYPEVD
jgi:predicted RNase H-like nuclease